MTFIEAEAKLGGIGAALLAGAGKLYTERRTNHPYRKGTQGECYQTAFGLATKHPELTYCEGRALSMGIVPIEHAWCVDADGLVVDTVWDVYQTEYVGVAFHTAFMRRWTASRRVYGVLAEMFPPELAEMAPPVFLANPTPAQITAAADVLARVRQLLVGAPDLQARQTMACRSWKVGAEPVSLDPPAWLPALPAQGALERLRCM